MAVEIQHFFQTNSGYEIPLGNPEVHVLGRIGLLKDAANPELESFEVIDSDSIALINREGIRQQVLTEKEINEFPSFRIPNGLGGNSVIYWKPSLASSF